MHTYTCIPTHIHTHTHTHKHPEHPAHTYTCTHTHTHMHPYSCTYTHTHRFGTSTTNELIILGLFGIYVVLAVYYFFREIRSLFRGPAKYFKSFWNIATFVLVVMALALVGLTGYTVYITQTVFGEISASPEQGALQSVGFLLDQEKNFSGVIVIFMVSLCMCVCMCVYVYWVFCRTRRRILVALLWYLWCVCACVHACVCLCVCVCMHVCVCVCVCIEFL
jgi:hypothetical protein